MSEYTDKRDAKQPRDERLAEVSRATVDAKLYGAGFIMILPDGVMKHVPLERIQIKPEVSEDQPGETR